VHADGQRIDVICAVPDQAIEIILYRVIGVLFGQRDVCIFSRGDLFAIPISRSATRISAFSISPIGWPLTSTVSAQRFSRNVQPSVSSRAVMI
jgi:hypothetical protein